MKNNYNFAARAAVLALTLSAAFSFDTSVRAQPPPGPLWYNGDFNHINGLWNERDTSLGSGQFSSVYDNFNVTGSGWNVTEVFSDNLMDTKVTGATWEIRRGTTLLNTGGTLVASGTTAAPIITDTGRGGFGFPEFEIKVTGLNLFLPVLPAGEFYWLNVTPIGDLTGRSFDSTTSGANCIGTPCGNDQNAFVNSNFFGVNFGSADDPLGPSDFSMGVNGTVVAPSGPLWYNGDFDNFTGAPNERDTALGSGQFSSIYGNFNVTGGGWNVAEVFSHNLVALFLVVTGATWEIRSGTTLVYTGGTLVASGTTATPIVTVIFCGGGFCEWEIKVTGLNVSLPVLPAGQFYWLNVTPISNLTGRSFISETMGANCVGTPCGNDGNTFWNSNFFDIKWKLTALQNRNPQDDFSMGVNGTVTPIPTPTPIHGTAVP